MPSFEQTRFRLPRGVRADAVLAGGVFVLVAIAEGQRLSDGWPHAGRQALLGLAPTRAEAVRAASDRRIRSWAGRSCRSTGSPPSLGFTADGVARRLRFSTIRITNLVQAFLTLQLAGSD